jgi:hypothetical protein
VENPPASEYLAADWSNNVRGSIRNDIRLDGVNGNINDFVKAHPDANRLDLVGSSSEVSQPSLQVR